MWQPTLRRFLSQCCGIYYVVDPGFAKQSDYNPNLHLDSLVTTPIPQGSVTQRAGRGGRTEPDECYRLYTDNASRNEMLPRNPKLRVNLTMQSLEMKVMGINDLLYLKLLFPQWTDCTVSALWTRRGVVTTLETQMAEFPLDPSRKCGTRFQQRNLDHRLYVGSSRYFPQGERETGTG